MRMRVSEIAERAGVSKGAVSYALNGRPGVSAETRMRILAIAREGGWEPRPTARDARPAGPRIALALARANHSLVNEPFYLGFIAGIQDVLAANNGSLLLQTPDSLDSEIATYQRMTAQGELDGVVLVDHRVEDPRPQILQTLQLPAVLVGDPKRADGLACVWTDDDAAMRSTVLKLAQLGHRRIARLAGQEEYTYAHRRDVAFRNAMADLGSEPLIVHTPGTRDATWQAITDLFEGQHDPPTAVITDTETSGIGTLFALGQLGLRVPTDVSIVAWDDSALSEMSSPAVTAVRRAMRPLGAHAARRLLDLIAGAEPQAYWDSTPDLIERESTGPAPIVQPVKTSARQPLLHRD